METKKIVTVNEVMGEEFLVSIPRNREYTSLEDKNGFANQIFSSDEMPRAIRFKCFAFIRCPSDGKIRPVCYSMDDLIREFYLKSEKGFSNGVDEINFLCKFFCEQNGLYDIRSLTKTDMPMIKLSGDKKETFWLGDCVKNNYTLTYSLAVNASYGGKVCEDVLFYSYGYERCCCHPIRPVIILDSEVQMSENQSRNTKINWV